MSHGRVSIQDLKDEQMQRGVWIQPPIPPGMPHLLADALYQVAIQQEEGVRMIYRALFSRSAAWTHGNAQPKTIGDSCLPIKGMPHAVTYRATRRFNR